MSERVFIRTQKDFTPQEVRHAFELYDENKYSFMRKNIYIIVIAILVASCNKAADTVVLGTIHTADKDAPVAEAIAIKDGKFIYVGDKAGVEVYIKDGVTQLVDHTDKGMVMPGCFEGHAHYLMGNSFGCMGGLSLDPLEDDVNSFFEKLKLAYTDAKEKGKTCIFGFGWNYFPSLQRECLYASSSMPSART